MATGARNGLAGQHADNPYPFFLHAGIKTICPSNAYDAKGLLISAIRENDPVGYFAPAGCLSQRSEVPEEPYAIPLGKGQIKRDGTDVTVIAVGQMVGEALKVAESMSSEGISVQVWDPRTLLPLDKEGVCSAVAKTGRAVIYDDANRTCGFAAELSSLLVERVFDDLVSPIKRVTRADVPIAFSAPLEHAALPSQVGLINAIRSICDS